MSDSPIDYFGEPKPVSQPVSQPKKRGRPPMPPTKPECLLCSLFTSEGDHYYKCAVKGTCPGLYKQGGRPRKHPDIIGPEPKPTEKVAKPRPPCELKPREYEHRKVVWGIRAENPKFKQKGIAVLHKESEGDMVILMPVTKDNPDDDIRWRYRYIPGPAPYQYAMIDLEPEQGNNLGDILIELGTALKEGVKEWFGSVQAAAKTSEDFIKTVHDDKLGDKIKRHGIW